MKKEIIKKVCKSENEVRKGTANLERTGFKRTQNCYWVEWWENENTRYEIERDF